MYAPRPRARTRRSRPTWPADPTTDPMYPFPPSLFPPDTTVQDSTRTPKRVTWGSIKGRYRRKAEDE